MKIEKTSILKIKATAVDNLDPISIYLEDYEKGKGEITIKCYDKVWKSYWGAMGDRTISEFFLSCDNCYLIKNLSNIASTINDYKTAGRVIKDYYKESIDSSLLDTINQMGDSEVDWDNWLWNIGSDTMVEVFGYEWWYEMPRQPNPAYVYLNRVVDAVKDILRAI